MHSRASPGVAGRECKPAGPSSSPAAGAGTPPPLLLTEGAAAEGGGGSDPARPSDADIIAWENHIRAAGATSQPLIGTREPIGSLETEYASGSEVFRQKIERLKETYSSIRCHAAHCPLGASPRCPLSLTSGPSNLPCLRAAQARPWRRQLLLPLVLLWLLGGAAAVERLGGARQVWMEAGKARDCAMDASTPRACLAPGGASGSLCTALPPPPHTHTHTRAHKLAFASLRGAAGHGASHAAGRGVGAGAADARGAGDQHARGNDQVGGVSAGCCVPEAALHVCASAGGARSGGWVDPRPRPPRCSNYAVWLLRMLTSCEIKRRADFFAPFVMVRGRQRRCAGCVGSSHAAGARLSGACLRLCATPLAGPGRL